MLLELIHTATLIHDDVIDEAKTRRGRPTLGVLFDNRVAVLMGDFILSSALVGAIALADLRIMGIVSAIGREAHRRGDPPVRDRRGRHPRRSHLLRYHLPEDRRTLPLLCRGRSDHRRGQRRRLCRAARIGAVLGMAFQIRDDIFDYHRSDVGKPTGNDIREGKITLPLLHVLTELQKEGKATPYLQLLEEKPTRRGEHRAPHHPRPRRGRHGLRLAAPLSLHR